MNLIAFYSLSEGYRLKELKLCYIAARSFCLSYVFFFFFFLSLFFNLFLHALIYILLLYLSIFLLISFLFVNLSGPLDSLSLFTYWICITQFLQELELLEKIKMLHEHLEVERRHFEVSHGSSILGCSPTLGKPQ